MVHFLVQSIILDGELTFYSGCLAFASAEVLRSQQLKSLQKFITEGPVFGD